MIERALIVGCGYTGERLARALRGSTTVVATVRTQSSAEHLRSVGIDALLLDLDTVTAASWPLKAEHLERSALFYLAPPPGVGASDTRLDRFLFHLKQRPDVFVYMSTTGVYGNQNGALVDESTPVNPQTERAQRRMSAEHMTRVWCTEEQVRRVVLRVPGIYGPGRLATLRLQRGEPFVRASEAGVSNRIHVDDLVSACVAVATNDDARGVYNVTDGNSMSSTAFMHRVAALARLPAPVEIGLEEARVTMSPERLSFLDESRRVSNARLVTELGVRLKYADIDAGIQASLTP